MIADWFKAENVTVAEECKYMAPIEKAMLVPKLGSPATYINYIRSAGLKLTSFEDVSGNVSKTWDISIELVGQKQIWPDACVECPKGHWRKWPHAFANLA